MNEFLRMVLHELQEAIGQAIVVLLLAVGIAVYTYAKHKDRYQRKQSFSFKRAVLWIIFSCYLTIVLYATNGRLGGMGSSGFSFHIFRSWREAWNNYSVTGWLNVLLNIVMMIPYGIFVPMLFKRCNQWISMLLIACITALSIESIQYLAGNGIFDIDDLLTNTLGSMIGYHLLRIITSIFQKKLWLLVLNLVFFLIPILGITGLFIAYDKQEYGNLPNSYTHQIDTSGIEWVQKCELSIDPQFFTVYKLDPPTQEQCDDLRDIFQSALGTEFERTDYYDESIMYMDQQGMPGFRDLTVQRIDGTYHYMGFWGEELIPAETNREKIEHLLDKFSITVPKELEFSYLHSGWHVFVADHVTIGSKIYDGQLSCIYNEGDILSEIKNNLLIYEYYEDTTIISPDQAYDRLREGRFGDPDKSFERNDPEKVIVNSCILSYAIDTKGFLQPVYFLDLTFSGTQEHVDIMIPAMQSASQFKKGALK